jgi:hypothetical protein
VKAALKGGEPAISVDTTKKELVGDFKNNGRELRPNGQPEPVRVHDFKIPELGKVAPCGIYDIATNHGWVSVGIDADTGAFAVGSIRRWWQKLGQTCYPQATSLTITADCGGANRFATDYPARSGRPAVRERRRARQEGGQANSLSALNRHPAYEAQEWRLVFPKEGCRSDEYVLQR